MSESTTTKTPAKPKPEDSSDQLFTQEFISRGNLAKRWDVTVQLLKNMERAGELKQVRLGYRSIAYRVREVILREKSMTD